VASALIENFDPARSVPLYESILEALIVLGFTESEAVDFASPKLVSSVRAQLSKIQPEQLPFDFSTGRPERLVGKRRVRPSDSRTAQLVRERLHLVEGLVETLGRIDAYDFEMFCAAVLLRNGASDANVTLHGDDGGIDIIDIYGRIPILVGDPELPEGLVRSTLSVRDILFLGQCKRYGTNARIDRGELQKFAGQARDCLTKYKGLLKRKPTHSLPDPYYNEDELCLTLFMASCSFTEGAIAYADSVNMVLADGRLLAELMLAWGFNAESSLTQSIGVREWAAKISRGRFFSGP
jgi:restriction endonuclease Mrr